MPRARDREGPDKRVSIDKAAHRTGPYGGALVLPLLRAPTVAAALARPYDNFALIRLALAVAVVVSHAFSVSIGSTRFEPLFAMTGFTLGEHAVNGFFAVSGFLVTMSFERRGWRRYVLARSLRLAPGLVVATLAVVALGAALTRLPAAEYWREPSLWRFILRTLTEFKSSAPLPGVFEANPYPFPMGTVWTLKYEVFCYIGVLVLGVSGLLQRRIATLVLVAGLFAGLVAVDAFAPNASERVHTTLRLGLAFSIGGCLYVWRDRAKVSTVAVAVLALATALLHTSPLYKALLFAAESYGVLWLALMPGLSHPALALRHDFSFGTYLYGWPVQQTVVHFVPTAGALFLLVPSLVVTLGVAAFSWFFVERPALSLKFRWGDTPRGDGSTAW
jgi:peptidoglycan/LPS O-acetylase OafA/YrhL